MYRKVPILFAAFLLLAAGAPFASAGSPDDPEMPDKPGDVDPLSLVGLKPQELEAVQSNATMFDILDAYITAENPSGFWFVVAVADLDGSIQSPDPQVATPAMIATFQTHFTVDGTAYFARAVLEPSAYTDTSQTPPVVMPYLMLNFTLHLDDLEETFIERLAGGVVPMANMIYYQVPKAYIGDPQVGDVMSGLYTSSYYRGQAMDHAPDLVLDPTAVDTGDPTKGVLVPRNDIVYDFGQYPGSGAPAKIELKASGETAASAAPGETVELALTVKNLGDKELKVRFASIDPYGWKIALDQTEMTLAGGSSDALVVTATATEKSRVQGVLRVSASTASETQTVVFVLQNPSAGSGGGGAGTGSGTPSTSKSPDQSLGSDDKESPAPAAVLLVGVALAAALVARRRRI